ncbi:MAG: CBS domain-containing protein [Nanoarchaeota archaeon]
MSAPVVMISPDATIYDAAKLMGQKKCGALVVLKEEKLVGIISERDIILKVLSQGKDYKMVKVGDIMVRNVYTVSPDATLLDISKMMNKYRIRHAIIMENGKVVGIITARDLIDMVAG